MGIFVLPEFPVLHRGRGAAADICTDRGVEADNRSIQGLQILFLIHLPSLLLDGYLVSPEGGWSRPQGLMLICSLTRHRPSSYTGIVVNS